MARHNPTARSDSPIRKLTRSLAAHTSALSLAFVVAVAPLAEVMVANPQAQAASQNRISIAPGTGGQTRAVNLGLNKSIVIDLPEDAHDILVANPKVADAVTRTSRRLYIFGKLVGQTNLFVFNGRGEQIAALEIRIERDIAGLEELIARFIPNSNIRAEMVNDNVVLTGTASNALESSRAVSLAEIYVNGGEELPDANPLPSNASTVIFEEEEESRVVNLIKIDGVDQVQLKVTLAEIRRNVVKQLGVTSSITNPRGDEGFGFNVVGAGKFADNPLFGTESTVSALSGLNTIQSRLRAMEQAGVMRTLAEPSLTAISGEAAEFRVGGTISTPESVECGEDGTSISVTQREYGIVLAFTPVVLSAGRISLKIHTEVNEPTSAGSITFCEGIPIPGMRKRLADTTVELPSGGSMVIGGLVQDDVRQTVTGFPGLKNIPVLGSLFRSREFVRNETELVLVVTPYLVRPTARAKIAQPDENFQPASDAAGYFMGRVNRVYGTKQGNLPKGRYTGSIGFILK